MVTLLSRLFIKNHEDTDAPRVRQAYGVLSGFVGIFLNLLLFAGKFFAGTVAHSIAITADAFNNLSDAASSVVTAPSTTATSNSSGMGLSNGGAEAGPAPSFRAWTHRIPFRACGLRRHSDYGF